MIVDILAVIVRGCKPVALILFQNQMEQNKNNIRKDHVENENKMISDHEKVQGKEKRLNIVFDSRFYSPPVLCNPPLLFGSKMRLELNRTFLKTRTYARQQWRNLESNTTRPK